MKKTKIILFLIFLIYPFFSYPHVNHYDKLKVIEMDVLRNGKKIGYNKYLFKSQNNLLIVENEINFAAKLMGINLLVVNGSEERNGAVTIADGLVLCEIFVCEIQYQIRTPRELGDRNAAMDGSARSGAKRR